MPIPVAIGAAAISAGGALAGTGASAYAQGRMNRKTRKWNEKMHDLTRREALSDWAMVNEYNSPAAQMQRYRDAGLSPHLIYGQTNEAPTVRSADTPAWNPQAPEFNLGNAASEGIQAYFNAKMNEAQVNNLQEAVTTQQSQQILNGAQTAATLQGTAKSKFDLEQAQSLSNYVIEQAKANLGKTAAETKQLLDNNERQAALTSSSLREAAERIAAIRLNNLKTQAETENTRAERRRLEQAVENIKTDTDLKKEDLELKRLGIQPHDPQWQRKLGQILDQYLKDSTDRRPKFDAFRKF